MRQTEYFKLSNGQVNWVPMVCFRKFNPMNQKEQSTLWVLQPVITTFPPEAASSQSSSFHTYLNRLAVVPWGTIFSCSSLSSSRTGEDNSIQTYATFLVTSTSNHRATLNGQPSASWSSFLAIQTLFITETAAAFPKQSIELYLSQKAPTERAEWAPETQVSKNWF